MALDLQTWLAAYMRDHSLSALEVASRIGYQSNTPISAVLRRERPVPLERLEEWIRAFHFRDEDAVIFRLLAHLDQSPEWLQDQYWRLDERVALQERDRVDLLRRLETAGGRVALAEQAIAQLQAELAAVRAELARRA